MDDLFTIDDIEQYLRIEVESAGGARKWCRKNKVSMDHALHMIENGSAASIDRVLDALGMEKVIRYKKRGR